MDSQERENILTEVYFKTCKDNRLNTDPDVLGAYINLVEEQIDVLIQEGNTPEESLEDYINNNQTLTDILYLMKRLDK